MIVPMTKYSFILLGSEKDNFLSELQEIGLVDITRCEKPIDEESSAYLVKADSLKKAIETLELLNYKSDTKVEIKNTEDKLSLFTKEYNNLQALETKLSVAQDEVWLRTTWGNFDKNILKQLSDRGYVIRYYCIDKKKFNPEWKNIYPLEIIEETKSKIYFVTISDDNNYKFDIECISAPKGSLKEAQDEVHKIELQINDCKSILMELKEYIPELKLEREHLLNHLDIYLAKKGGQDVNENHITVFEGFAPTENDEQLCSKFDSMSLIYLKEKANTEDNPPIKLKNNWFTRMFAPLTDMYGRPDYNEFDPTPYLSIFFLLFFAMCMGDAGYGCALIIIGLILRKNKAVKEMAPLVTTLGVATLFVGFFMHTCFGVDLRTISFIPQWMKDCMLSGKIQGFEIEMVLSIIVGIIHLCLAMIVKTIYATKNKGFLGSLSIWGWTVLIVGSVVIGSLASIGLIQMSVTKWIIIGLAIPCCIAIFLLNNLKRNPLINIGSGLWETYNTATGLLGDVLSYLRIYALGLAGGMLGQAFNQIGMMTIGNEFGLKPQLIFFILIVVLGHSLNLAMCCLGAFVHPLRLNFLEFFKNSDYQGKGKTYRPIKK